MIVAGFSSLFAVGAIAWRHRLDTGGPVTPPFQLAESAWRSVLTVAATTDRSCPASVPLVILYVSSTCSHCTAELARWAALVRTRSPSLSCIGVAVVAAPSRADSAVTWLPAELKASLVWDHDRDFARALQVRQVPLSAYITRNGLVISRAVGEASDSSTRRNLEELRRVSGTNAGGIRHD